MLEFFTTPTGMAMLGLAGVAVAYVTWLTGLFQWFWDKGRKPEPVVVNTTPIQEGSQGTVTLTIEKYEETLRAREAEVAARIEAATGSERERLLSEKAELERRLADIDAAFAEAKAKIAELEALLAREGNAIGGDRLADARAALERGDFSQADALFAEIEAREQPAVQSAARAAFARGEIAEEQIRWADAAAHYGRAAGLEASYRHLRKASDYCERAGRYADAAGFSQRMIAAAQAEFGDETAQHATALNEHALNLRAMGRLDEAEPLYRQALEIDANTIGTAHPDYATHLNNLAGLLKQMGRISEARPLLDEAVAIRRKSLGEDHPAFAVSLWWKADFSRADGDWAAARDDYRNAYAVFTRVMGKDHPETRKLAEQFSTLLRAHFPDDPALGELEAAFGTDIGR